MRRQGKTSLSGVAAEASQGKRLDYEDNPEQAIVKQEERGRPVNVASLRDVQDNSWPVYRPPGRATMVKVDRNITQCPTFETYLSPRCYRMSGSDLRIPIEGFPLDTRPSLLYLIHQEPIVISKECSSDGYYEVQQSDSP